MEKDGFATKVAPKKLSAPIGWQPEQGFTLIELIMVIVILGILALGTTRYIVQSMEQYTQSADRAKLIAAGRIAVEKMTRRLRNALPNSVRVSASGSCIEYFPVLGATSYEGVLPVPVSTLVTASFALSSAAQNYAVIAALAPSELYKDSYSASEVIAQTTFTATGARTDIPLQSAHSFTRTSPTQRVYLVGTPERFCASNNALTFYSGYNIDHSFVEGSPGGTATLIAESIDVTDPQMFEYVPGTQVRNALVNVSLNLLRSGDPVKITHRVQIRNVP